MADVEPGQLARRLYDAFNIPGFLGLGGTDEDEVLKVLRIARDAGVMSEVKVIYSTEHPDELGLEEELYDELSGNDLRVALRLYREGLGTTTPPKASTKDNGPVQDGMLAPMRSRRSQGTDKSGRPLYYVPFKEKYLPRISDPKQLQLIRQLEENRKKALTLALDALRKLQSDIRGGAPRYEKQNVVCLALGKYMGIFPNDGKGLFDDADPKDHRMVEKLDEICERLEQNRAFSLTSDDYYVDEASSQGEVAAGIKQMDYGPPAGRFAGIVLASDFFDGDSTRDDLRRLVILHEYFHVVGFAGDDYNAMREQRGLTFAEAAKMAICLGGVAAWIAEGDDIQDKYGYAPLYVKSQ